MDAWNRCNGQATQNNKIIDILTNLVDTNTQRKDNEALVREHFTLLSNALRKGRDEAAVVKHNAAIHLGIGPIVLASDPNPAVVDKAREQASDIQGAVKG